jgi:hypothetical protein
MPALFAALASFLTPVVIFFVSVGVIVAFLLAALADPQGWMNKLIVSAIDYIVLIFPSTPLNLRIGSLIDSLGTSLPFIGKGIIREIISTIISIFSIRAIIVIYKLLPFKAS